MLRSECFPLNENDFAKLKRDEQTEKLPRRLKAV